MSANTETEERKKARKRQEKKKEEKKKERKKKKPSTKQYDQNTQVSEVERFLIWNVSAVWFVFPNQKRHSTFSHKFLSV